MSEIVKEWLKELYKGAIEEQLAAIDNERLWANGAPDGETAQMHEDNVNNIEEYISVLKEKLANLEH